MFDGDVDCLDVSVGNVVGRGNSFCNNTKPFRAIPTKGKAAAITCADGIEFTRDCNVG